MGPFAHLPTCPSAHSLLMGRWTGAQVGRWADGQVGRLAGGQTGSWAGVQMGRWAGSARIEVQRDKCLQNEEGFCASGALGIFGDDFLLGFAYSLKRKIMLVPYLLNLSDFPLDFGPILRSKGTNVGKMRRRGGLLCFGSPGDIWGRFPFGFAYRLKT